MSMIDLNLTNSPLPEPPLNTQDIAARLTVLLADRFVMQRLIGIGGMASVYLARHRVLHTLFAIKVLHPTHAERPDLLARFQREGLLGARLDGHPHIVPVIDVCEGDGLHYMLMPYIRGEDLDHLLARVGPFCLNDALLAVMQINDAILYAWKNGILHSDLSPSNIRLNTFGQFILFDFGLATTEISNEYPLPAHIATQRLGSPLYMSPERIVGNQIDIRSDLYALGAIFYELLTGEAAFSGDSIMEIERNHLSPGPIFFHPNLQKHLLIHPLLNSLLSVSPAERFTNPIALQQALGAFIRSSPLLSVSPKIEFEQETTLPRRRLSSDFRAFSLFL